MNPLYLVGIGWILVLIFCGVIRYNYDDKINKPNKQNISKEKMKTIKYKDPQLFEVGMTSVEITFTDDRKFTVWLSGYYYQNVDYGLFHSFEVSAEKGYIVDSNKVAENYIKALDGTKVSTFPDYQECPTEVVMGIPKHAVILETTDCQKEFKVAYVSEE